ncbi:MAG: elongation factor G [Myxococcales bacterium]|nr:elongation factor G [Myxococcales bacterium]
MSKVKERLSKLRNIGIMAHIDAGKTTTTERILYYTGVNYKIGEVHDGEATMDYRPDEQEKGITITSAVTEFDWKGHHVQLIDTPGHVDFTVEVERSLRVLDGVVALYDAVQGVEPQSETVWYQADKYRVPRIAFINKMDRVGANFERCVQMIRDKFHVTALPIQLPIGAEGGFKGIVDVVERTAWQFRDEDRGVEPYEVPVPDDMVDAMAAAREALIDGLSLYDDALAEAFLMEEPIDAAQIKASLRRSVIALNVVPVMCGSGLKDKGIQPLLDAVVDYLPSPMDMPPVQGRNPETGEPELRELVPSERLAVLAFKVQMVGGRKQVYLRIYSGTLNAGDKVLNVRLGRQERVSRLFKVHSSRRQRVDAAHAGDLVTAAGLKDTFTGDTLTDPAHPLLLESIEARNPVISASIEPEKRQDRDKLLDVLAKIADEDPTFLFKEDEDTGELIIRGMGELHLEIVAGQIDRDYNLTVKLGEPNVVYRETATVEATGHGVFERDTDEGSIFGDVRVAVSPRDRSAGNAIAIDDALKATLPPNLEPMLLAGVEDALVSGPVMGEPLEDVGVVVTAVGFKENFSLTPLGYRIAAGIAVRNAMADASAAVLEPVMEVDIVVPEDFLGDVIGDLTQRSGRIENVADDGPMKIITCRVGLRKMFGYTTTLRSMTQGRGVFTMSFDAFDIVS